MILVLNNTILCIKAYISEGALDVVVIWVIKQGLEFLNKILSKNGDFVAFDGENKIHIKASAEQYIDVKIGNNSTKISVIK